MDLSHTLYAPVYRQRPEALALLFMTMTLATPANANSNITSFATRQGSGQFDSNNSENIINAIKLEIIEKRKRQLKQRISKSIHAGFGDELFSLPYKTADLLAELGIEPNYILPTADGGLSIEFQHNGTYHLIEFMQTGEIAFLKKKDRRIDAWDLTTDNYLSVIQAELV